MRAGIPMQIVVDGEFVAECEGRNGRESINMTLLGRQPKGTWILTFFRSAREILNADEAAKLNNELNSLEAVLIAPSSQIGVCTTDSYCLPAS